MERQSQAKKPFFIRISVETNPLIYLRSSFQSVRDIRNSFALGDLDRPEVRKALITKAVHRKTLDNLTVTTKHRRTDTSWFHLSQSLRKRTAFS